MSASNPAVDRRPTPTVAIVGNDAVLAAAPATPVQLAHACLRRGFTVAVPASWGDELIAAEATRQLASRDKGPAVMCVCPYVRSRLLAPGPDLAPFLVSLVSPPIAAARYLRTVYGERGVHITYIGGCPSADDSSIDARLTPDAFIADLAEHGIALSEQPLVFDSIVPPDRRRWCSMPGGVPSAEVLWSEPAPRTLVEIDRDDVAADLAQHIIAQEPVLLDLAPSLGCACSGAVGTMPPRHARSAVTALEPPRALSPVIDPHAIVPLDVPVGEPSALAPTITSQPLVSDAPAGALELVLDEMLGAGIGELTIEPAGELASRLATSAAVILDMPLGTKGEPVAVVEIVDELEIRQPHAAAVAPNAPVSTVSSVTDTSSPPIADRVATGGEALGALTSANTLESRESRAKQPFAEAEAVSSPVRRRTPPAMARYSSASIPKATGADGRPLPRAYVAKRRTPSSGTAVVDSPALVSEPGATESASPTAPAIQAADSTAPSIDAGAGTDVAGYAEPPVSPATEAVSSSDTAGAATTNLTTPGELIPSTAASPVATQPAEPPSREKRATPPSDGDGAADSNGRRGRPVATPAANQGVLMFLLLTAVLTLGVFAVLMLRP